MRGGGGEHDDTVAQGSFQGEDSVLKQTAAVFAVHRALSALNCLCWNHPLVSS